MRVVKDADIRREELLDAALLLFLENGYERTSVQQVTTTVGVAKGTFYHYFETKADLLEQLVERLARHVLAETERALAATPADARERLRVLLAAGTQAKIGRKDETLMLSRPLFMPGNRALLGRLVEGWIDRTRPLLRSVVDQGCAQGVFDLPNPAAMTEVLLSLWYDYGLRVSRLFFEAQDGAVGMEDVAEAVRALELAQERVLGVQPGGLDMNLVEGLRPILDET